MTEDSGEQPKLPDVGHIFDKYLEEKKLGEEVTFDPPVGEYQLIQAIPPLMPDDGLNHVGTKTVKVVEWERNGVLDPITRTELKKGEKAVVLGNYGYAVAVDTFEELLKQKSDEVILPVFSA